MRSSLAALIVAGIGVAVLYAITLILHGLVEPVGATIGCAVGAFGSTLWTCERSRRRGMSRLWIATLIVVPTYVFIAAGVTLWAVAHGQGLADKLHEAPSLLLWEVLATSWWLIPSTMLVMAGLRRLGLVESSPPLTASVEA